MNFTDVVEVAILRLGRFTGEKYRMKALTLGLITVSLALAAAAARADETPVFVSCYAADGANVMLEFDTAQTQFIYRYQNGDQVVSFESAPKGALGASNSSVTKAITDNHKVLTAHIVAGDDEQPIIDTDVEVIFDRDNTGSLVLTSSSFYHLSQAISMDEFRQPGACYVQ
jgi:hypothetical protein